MILVKEFKKNKHKLNYLMTSAFDIDKIFNAGEIPKRLKGRAWKARSL